MKSHNKGQAFIEYLLVLVITAGIGVFMFKGMVSFFGTTLTRLGYSLSQQLSVGVCESECLTHSYRNRLE